MCTALFKDKQYNIYTIQNLYYSKTRKTLNAKKTSKNKYFVIVIYY